MKRLSTIASILALMILSAACGQNPQQKQQDKPEKPQPAPEIIASTISIDYYDDIYSEGDAFTSIGQILFLACEGFDELLGTIADVNQATRSRMEATRESVAEMVADESTKELRASTYPWKENIFYTCRRCDARILSFTITDDVLTGGDKPDKEVISWNIDCKSGKVLELDEVTADKEAFQAAVREKAGAAGADAPEVWYFTGNGLELCFTPGLTIALGPEFIKPEYLPVPVEEKEFKAAGTKVFREVFIPFTGKVGKANWYESEALIKEMGVAYTPYVPYESETDGMFRTDDPENGFVVDVMFWPGEGFTEECITGSDFSKNFVYNVSYFNDEWSLSADNNYMSSIEPRWYIIDYTIHERYCFKSQDEAMKVFQNFCLR